MLGWLHKKTRLECLQNRYVHLMRKSYNTALIDIEKSDRLHNQAQKIWDEISYLNLKQGDK